LCGETKVLFVFGQLTAENSELEKQIAAMKETQQEFIAEVCTELTSVVSGYSAYD